MKKRALPSGEDIGGRFATCRNTPSLSRVPFDGSGFVIRYYKRSLMLDHFRHIMGDDQFFRASREFFQNHRGQSIGTVEFRSFWKRRLEDHKKLLDVWLDSTGGLPVTAGDVVVRKTGRQVTPAVVGPIEGYATPALNSKKGPLHPQ